MRPIDADALIEVIKKSMAENPHKEEMQRAMHIHEHKYFLTLLAGIPTIQPVATDTNVGDKISRQAAIEKFTMTAPQMSVIRIYEAVEILESMPTAQPEPHEGEWEQVSAQRYFMSASYFYRCSACGVNNVRNTNFCPHCGAKMTISTK